ncbi:MAG: hypothetical protein R3B40_28375 [Polyangiales bacterium]
MPAWCMLAWHVSRYWPFIADDALISLRYAQRLTDGAGLTWTVGVPVEGYSNLLWVLGCAGLGALSVDLITAARVLGMAGMALALACVALFERPRDRAAYAGGALAAVHLALIGAIGVWAIGGLEQPLVAGLLALGLWLAQRLVEGADDARTWPASCALALLCLTRPDGAYLAALVGLGVILARGVSLPSMRVAMRLGVWPVVAVLGQLAFRLAYYGDWVPNTARAKLALSSARLEQGWDYVFEAGVWYWPLALLVLPALRRPTRAMALIVVPLVGWLAYVVFIGGDIFPGRRHMVPAVVCLALLGSVALTRGLRGPRDADTRRKLVSATLTTMLAMVAMGWQWRLTAQDPANHRAVEERWEWDGQVVGHLLGDAFRSEQPLVAADPAGCIPYFSELPALDLLGLNDRYLATHPPPDFGRGFLGHELGDGDYVWSQTPDLLLFCGPHGSDRGCFRSGHELRARPDFRAHYQLVTFEGREPYAVRSQVWVRRDGRVGVRTGSDGERHVPGFLLTGPGVVAALDAEGQIAAELPAGATAVLDLRGVDGSWSAALTSDVPLRAVVQQGRVVVFGGRRRAHVRAVVLTPR